MTTAADYTAELYELAGAQCEGTITSDQAVRLEELVLGDDRLRRLYVLYMQIHACAEQGEGLNEDVGKSRPGARDSCNVLPPPGIILPPFSSLSAAHYPPTTNFVGGPVFSYMVATVVLCAMLLSAWAYKITLSDGRFVDNSTPSVVSKQQMEFVGRITGMADCKWSNPNTRPYSGSYVPLGRKYELASGLLEITYAGGARVILEGPCVYTVDSNAGGSLRQGKLVARVKKNDELGIRNKELRRQESDIHHSSFINHPLFSVTTPTAVVTDLGTEFGVEVGISGNTFSRVFQGSVKFEAPGDSSKSVILKKDETASACSGPNGTTIAKVMTSFVPRDFIRDMPRLISTGLPMSGKDSAEFRWKYEMDVDPTAQDLDANPGPDWKLMRGAVQVNGDGTATLAAAGESMGSLISGGPGDPEHAIGHVWNNISKDTGYTVELRIKVVGTVPWYGHNLGLYLTANNSTVEKSSMVVITNESTLWDRISRYLVDNNRNDDDFHVFRIAQEPNSGQYQVWRDGVLVRLSEGFQPQGWNRVHFGDMGTGSGPNVVDYVRITAGAHAPPKRLPAAHSPDGVEKTKEKPPMEH